MANSVPFRTTPQLGMQLDDVNANYWDLRGLTFASGVNDPATKQPVTSDVIDISSKVGTRETGGDGRDYILVRAGDDLAKDTQVSLTDFVAKAGGNSGVYTQAFAVKKGDFFWAAIGQPLSAITKKTANPS